MPRRKVRKQTKGDVLNRIRRILDRSFLGWALLLGSEDKDTYLRSDRVTTALPIVMGGILRARTVDEWSRDICRLSRRNSSRAFPPLGTEADHVIRQYVEEFLAQLKQELHSQTFSFEVVQAIARRWLQKPLDEIRANIRTRKSP